MKIGAFGKPPSDAAAREPASGAAEAVALRDLVERHRASLAERLAGGEDGMALGQANARFLDKCVAARFESAAGQARQAAAGMALAAAGSFGRGAVALRSDADVALIINPKTVNAKSAASFAEALLYPLWDATFTVGHQVLSAAEAIRLAAHDLATATVLLDLRLLAGNGALLQDLVDRAQEALFGEEDLGAFIDRLDVEAGARHERFGGSVYLLEPDVKSGAGGLRDLDGARWAARARYRVGEELSTSGPVLAPARGSTIPPAAMPLGMWGELVRLGVLVPREA